MIIQLRITPLEASYGEVIGQGKPMYIKADMSEEELNKLREALRETDVYSVDISQTWNS